MNYTIAVDFDGTLFEDAFPEIGKPCKKVIKELKKMQKKGATILLWTCREDIEERNYLTEAIEACKEQGIVFDAINDNPFNPYAQGKKQSRKIYANEYWDDRAVIVQKDRIYLVEDLK